MLSNPATARKGNLIAAAGMLIAIVGTIFLYEDEGNKLGNYGWIFAGLIIGSVIGSLAAKKVKMTAMPEMVSLFNGTGGACAALISIVEFNHLIRVDENINPSLLSDIVPGGHYLTIIAGAIIGSISFAGSIIAWGKLSGKISDFSFKGQHAFNLVILALVILAGVITYNSNVQSANVYFFITVALALLYGVSFVLPIGGADMPVVISLLNSFTGVAAACGGFLYHNQVMLTGGILVGAAGTLLYAHHARTGKSEWSTDRPRLSSGSRGSRAIRRVERPVPRAQHVAGEAVGNAQPAVRIFWRTRSRDRPRRRRSCHHSRNDLGWLIRRVRYVPHNAYLADDRARLGSEPLPARRSIDGTAGRDLQRETEGRSYRAGSAPPCDQHRPHDRVPQCRIPLSDPGRRRSALGFAQRELQRSSRRDSRRRRRNREWQERLDRSDSPHVRPSGRRNPDRRRSDARYSSRGASRRNRLRSAGKPPVQRDDRLQPVLRNRRANSDWRVGRRRGAAGPDDRRIPRRIRNHTR